MPLDLTKTAGRAIARSVLGKGLKRVAGNLAGLIDGGLSGNGSDFGDIANRSSQRTNMLAFPLDILSDPGKDGGKGNHGHYMMFYINVQESATLNFSRTRERFEIADGLRQERRRREINPNYDGSVEPIKEIGEQLHTHMQYFNKNNEAFKRLKDEGGGAERFVLSFWYSSPNANV